MTQAFLGPPRFTKFRPDTIYANDDMENKLIQERIMSKQKEGAIKNTGLKLTILLILIWTVDKQNQV